MDSVHVCAWYNSHFAGNRLGVWAVPPEVAEHS